MAISALGATRPPPGSSVASFVPCMTEVNLPRMYSLLRDGGQEKLKLFDT